MTGPAPTTHPAPSERDAALWALARAVREFREYVEVMPDNGRVTRSQFYRAMLAALTEVEAQ